MHREVKNDTITCQVAQWIQTTLGNKVSQLKICGYWLNSCLRVIGERREEKNGCSWPTVVWWWMEGRENVPKDVSETNNIPGLNLCSGLGHWWPGFYSWKDTNLNHHLKSQMKQQDKTSWKWTSVGMNGYRQPTLLRRTMHLNMMYVTVTLTHVTISLHDPYIYFHAKVILFKLK